MLNIVLSHVHFLPVSFMHACVMQHKRNLHIEREMTQTEARNKNLEKKSLLYSMFLVFLPMRTRNN